MEVLTVVPVLSITFIKKTLNCLTRGCQTVYAKKILFIHLTCRKLLKFTQPFGL